MTTSKKCAGLLFGALFFLLGCGSATKVAAPVIESAPPAASTEITFSKDILPLLRGKFAPALADESGLSFDSWESIMRGSDNGEILVPFDAERSLIIRALTAGQSSRTRSITPMELERITTWINEGAKNDAGDVPFADSENLLYVCNQAAALVSVIDMDANVVIRNVDLRDYGLPMDAKPHHVAVEPDGSAWYLSLIGSSKVLKFSKDNELLGEAEFETPGMLALHPTEDKLFVGRSMMAVSPPQRVGYVVPSTMEIEEVDVLFPRPHALTVNPATGHVYTASLSENSYATILPDSQEVALATMAGPTHTLVQFALSPDGSTMVAGAQLTAKLFFFDMSDPGAPMLTDSLAVNAAPWHPVFSPSGQRVYFGNKMANTVSVVNMATRELEAVIDGNGLSQPHGAAVSRDGKYLYVSNNNLKGAYKPRLDLGNNANVGTLVVIDTQTLEIVKVLELHNYASGIGARPPR